MMTMPPEPMMEPSFLERFLLDRRVEVLRGDDAAGRTTALDGLELFAVGNTTADFVDDIAQRRPERDFNSRCLDFAGEREDLGALGLLGANVAYHAAPLRMMPGMAAQVSTCDVGGLAPKTALGRKADAASAGRGGLRWNA